MNRLWGCPGRPTQEDLELIRTRKPEEPKLEITLKDGSKRNVWCTFGPQQIDIDVSSPSGHLSYKTAATTCLYICTAQADLHQYPGVSLPISTSR